MGLAFIAVLVLRRHEGRPGLRVSVRNLGVAILCGAAVSLLFYSSFFTHWEGVLDSVRTYKTYFNRAGGNASHGHPWYYFLQMLTFARGEHGPLWTEAGIILFGLVGVWSAFKEKSGLEQHGRDLRIFLGVYALLMFTVSSAIPYKTPWLALGALQPFILAAGCGLSTFLRWLDARRLRIPGILAVTAIIAHLAWQAYLANFVYYDDPVNPYVYSHPTSDITRVSDAVREVMRGSPEGSSMPLQVVCPGDDYWPLPWYLRSLPNVGWWNAVAEDFVPTRVILASPEVEPALLLRLYERPSPGQRRLYVSLFDRPMFLRPGREIRGYVALDLWNKTRKE
jgi:predicted membrane-bound mannosyltransferase